MRNRKPARKRNERSRKALSDLYFLLLLIMLVMAIVLIGEFVGQYFGWVYNVFNIKGQINIFMVNDDAGTELVSLLSAKHGSLKHIERLGNYLSEDYSYRIEPVKGTLDSFANYDFTLNGIGSANFKKGVPTTIQDSSRQAIVGCGVAAPDTFTLKWPTPALTRISSGFGPRERPPGACQCHGGIDIAGEGPVYGISDSIGVVTGVDIGCVVGNKECNGRAGNYAVVKYTFGNNDYYAYFMHLKEANVRVNDEVGTGTLIGTSGNTGDSDGSHLHLEIRTMDKSPAKKGEYSINPCKFDNMPANTEKPCQQEPVSVCQYVSGKSVRGYDTEIPLPGAKSGNPRGTVTFKQWS
jgi:hypothetical protein